jgi:hypothetical protein
MPDTGIDTQAVNQTAQRFRFHPLVRCLMLLMGTVTAGYAFYFITILIPHSASNTVFFKIVSVVVLYVALSTVYNHLTALNSVIIRAEGLELGFLIRKRLFIPWHNLLNMEIYKVITHYWKLTYVNSKGITRIFRTSLAFPGIIKILLAIQDRKPDVELNELLKQVLIYKRKTTPQ